MKNLYIIFISVIFGMLLAACTITVQEPDNIVEVIESKTEVNEVVEGDSENEEVEEAKEEDVVEVDATIDIEAVFTKMKEASKTIDRVAITAETKTTTTMGGVTSIETSTIDGKLQIAPAVQHIINTATSGEATDGEMYVTEDATYFSTEDSEGWIKFNHRQNDGVVGVLQKEQLAHLIDYQDAFELAEDDTHFIITYIGADELYKEIFYGGPMKMNTIAGDLSAQIKKMEVTGSLTMRVSKETFLVDSQISLTDVTMHETIVIHTIDEATQNFTDYNQLDEVVVPEDIIENAISINPGA